MKKIVAVGDSITWGFPYGEKASWVHFLNENQKKFILINKGMNGDTFQGILYRLQEDVIALSPDYCILTAGINDIFMGYSLLEIQGTILQIIEKLKKNNIQIIFGIPVNIPDRTVAPELSQLQQWLLEYANKNEVIFIDFRNLSVSDFDDEVHPNNTGYLKMGKKALETLNRLS